MALCIEAGKPIHDARGEVTRLIDTFRIAAEESVRIDGEVHAARHLAARARATAACGSACRSGRARFISPVQLPAEPGRAQDRAGDRRRLPLRAQAGQPHADRRADHRRDPGRDRPAGGRVLDPAVRAARAPTCSPPTSASSCCRFTGSPAVGWDLKARAGKKKVVLELGGNAAVHRRRRPGRRPRRCGRAPRLRRLLPVGPELHQRAAHPRAREPLRRAARTLVAAHQGARMGDPKDEDTFIGPMISEDEAERLDGWIQTAQAARRASCSAAAGARARCSRRRCSRTCRATATVSAEEAFGPVAVLSSFGDFDAALAEVNDSDFGLQAGVFTRDLYKAMQAWDELEVGGVRDRRRADLPRRQHALRRGQGQRASAARASASRSRT